jgi:hypothetical protein
LLEALVESGCDGVGLPRNEKVVGSIPTGGSTQTSRSSLKERGRSRGACDRCSASPLGLGRAEGRRRGQGSGVARPRSGRRALTSAPFGARCGWRRRVSAVRSVAGSGGRRCARHGRCPRRWQSWWGAAVIPSLRQAWRHDGVRGAGPAGSIRGTTTPRVGVLTWATRADRFGARLAAHAAVLAGDFVCWSRARTWWSRSA